MLCSGHSPGNIWKVLPGVGPSASRVPEKPGTQTQPQPKQPGSPTSPSSALPRLCAASQAGSRRTPSRARLTLWSANPVAPPDKAVAVTGLEDLQQVG